MDEFLPNSQGLSPDLVPVCAIGASAGGLTALRSFFQQIDTDLGFAYVVIVHLSPDHPSAMGEILAACTRMPVQQVNDGPVLRPNCVYVIPPDRELVIKGDEVTAQAFSQPRGHRAPIDLFFRSVAAARGDGLAIVLSGSGSDGAVGVRAIKEAGGVIFVQDPAEAEYAMMPQNAIATGVADFVSPIGAMVDRIREVAHSKDAVRSLNADAAANDLRRIVNFMRARTGHDFSSYKRATVMRRVTRRMQVTRSESLEGYASYVRDTPEEAHELFSDLLISVTMFFRDHDAFDALCEQAINRIFDDLDETGIRVWVVGCATGEEAYSIAMLLLEEASRRRVHVPIQIFATDLDEGALATAREGRYPRSIQGDVSEERLTRWFVDEGTHYRVRQELRDPVLFASHSVLKDPPFMRLDLITCRNLLIYLERALQRQLATLFHYGLKPNRFLFLGSAETLDSSVDLFSPIDRESRIYRARQQAVRTLPHLPQLPSDQRAVPERRREGTRGEIERGSAAAHIAALERNVPPSILVDESQRIINLSPSAGSYILHSGGPFTIELPAVVRPELRLDLAIALERAFGLKQPTVTLPVVVAFDGMKRRVSMYVMPTVADEVSAQQAVVFFMDGGEVQPLENLEEHELTDRPDQTRRLHEELKIAHERLNASRQEYQVATQDLRAANEELQSINEEYRSTAEELETSKEELQSMNEELQTVNSELKSKLEHISSAHNDLQNLTAATEVGTLFLDTELRIRMFTAPVAEIFNIAGSDVGREITDFTHRMVYDGIERDAQKVLRDLTPLESVVESKGGRSYMMRVRPYRTVEDRIDGVVITFVDISARLIAERQLIESERRYHMLFDSIDEGFCIIEVMFDADSNPVDYRFIDVNAAFERQTGLKSAMGKTMRSLLPAHEQSWFDIYGRIAVSKQAERFENYAAGLGRHYEVYAFPVSGSDNRVGILFNDVTKRKESERHLRLMVAELDHRVKNTLAVVQAIAQQSFKHQDIDPGRRKAFEGRLAALAAAHNILTLTHWEKAALHDVVASVVASCGGREHRFDIQGPAIDLHASQAVPIAMALHELCTNAVKYGAFSVDRGRVKLEWSVTKAPETRLRMEWKEIDGPPVKVPTHRGFGSMMVEQALAYEFGGTATIQFLTDGVLCVIDGPMDMKGAL
ncbi:MAG: chemotaxis protein CheB [Povalibacter sp.]